MRGNANSRLFNLVEALAFSALVALYIWQLQAPYKYSWLIFPAWLIASFSLHRDTPATLGWRMDNLWIAAKKSGVILLPFGISLSIVGLFLGGFDRPFHHLLVPRRFFGYMFFCVLQQVGLNSYVTNRLLAADIRPAGASLIAGTIFAALHWPNPILIPLTWIGGAVMAWLFAEERNIFPLAGGQAVLGTMVWWAFPVAWHHAMRVGPGFYNFHPR
jgi:hypothetical protein